MAAEIYLISGFLGAGKTTLMVKSCFLRSKDGAVTYPMGNTMHKNAIRGKNTIYQYRDACRQCPNKCTGSSNYKTVSFGQDTQCIPVIMYGSPQSKAATDSPRC